MTDLAFEIAGPQSGRTLGVFCFHALDEATFGFKVGEVRDIDWDVLKECPSELAAGMQQLADRHHIALAYCTIEGRQAAECSALQEAHFRFIEARLIMRTVPNRQAYQWPRDHIRAWHQDDRDALVKIAENVFVDGRFVSDAKFPRSLAKKRYAVILEQAMNAAPSSGIEVHVTGEIGTPNAFLYTWSDGTRGEYRLGAATTHDGSGIAAARILYLYRGVRTLLHSRAVKSISAQVGAASATIIDTYVKAHFTVDSSQLAFHWHNPNARQLTYSHSSHTMSHSPTDPSDCFDQSRREHL